MGAVGAGGRIEVDPVVLLRAGQRMGSIGAQLDALSTSLGAALGSGIASGWDPAGAHFGLTYGDDAQKFATTLAEAANAFKYSGQRLAASGYNYKNADAGSTIGGRTPMGSVGDAPSETKAVDAPTGPSGATVPPPPNWWLIDGLLNAIPFIGPVAGAVMTWPQGNPSLMRLTAAQWHNFATGLAAFNDDVPALKTAVSQERIPEQPKIQECLGQLGEYLPYLADLAKTIGENVDHFANGVQKAQDAIRRLLDRISPEGLWDTVTGFLTGEGDDILRQVADDVGAVLENFQQEVKGIVGLLSDLSKALGEALDAFQKWVKPALEATFGNEVGGALADAVTFYTDVQLGLVNGVIGTVSGLVSLADVDVLKGMAEMALSVAEDPTKLPGVLENMGKQFIAYDQLTGDHPGRGVGEAAFNIGTLFLPGAAASKTGSIAKGLRYGSKLLDEGRLPRISDIPGMGGGRSLPSVDDLPGAGPGHPGAPEFTPPQLPESLANPPSAPHAPEAPRTPQELGGSGGPPGGGGPPDPPGGRPVGPPDSGPGRAEGPAPQSPSAGAGEPSRVSEPTAPSAQTPPAAPSHAPTSGDSPAPAAPHAPESPSPASPHETGGQSPSEPSPSPTEHSPATPEPHANGTAEPRADGNYAPNESHQPASEGHTGGTADGTHAPADHQPAAHTPTTESPGTHEPTRTDNGQSHEPTRAPGDAADARPHEPAATTPAAPMAGGMPMAPHTGGGVHSPSDGPASRAPSPEPPARTPESKAPQASSPETPRTTAPASAGPGPSGTPSAPVNAPSSHTPTAPVSPAATQHLSPASETTRPGREPSAPADRQPTPAGRATGNDNAGNPGGPQPPDPPNNPSHTGLHDPPANHGIAGDSLPDLSTINDQFRLADGSVDPDKFDEWTAAVAEAYPRIGEDGVAGVYDYTTENYQGMNPYLRDIDPLSPEQQSILGADSIDDMTDTQRSSWEERISNTDGGLAALPPYRADPADAMSTTWRGMHASDELLGQLKVGEVFEDPAYLSTSLDSRVAGDFALSADPGRTPTLLSIEGYNGVDVSQISRYTTEAEILFPRGSRFEVTSHDVGDDGLIHIVLRQIQP